MAEEVSSTTWTATFDTDGSGNWQVDVPVDASFEDMEAFAPVIDAGRAFLQPTADHAA